MSRRIKGERGAAAVEFALVLPLLLTIVLGGIEFGLMVQARSNASNAAREAVRYASLGYSESNVKAVAYNSLTTVSGTATVTAWCSKPAEACTLGPGATGGVATVKVVIHYKGITGFFGALVDTDVAGQSTMRVE